MPHYDALHCTIDSDVALPGLAALSEETTARVTVRRASAAVTAMAAITVATTAAATATAATYSDWTKIHDVAPGTLFGAARQHGVFARKDAQASRYDEKGGKGEKVYAYHVTYRGGPVEIIVAPTAEGATITWYAHDDVLPDEIATTLTGALLSAAASLCGETILHGAWLRLVVDQGAALAAEPPGALRAENTVDVLIFAGSGTGKSSLALALATAGAHLIADDSMAVRCSANSPPSLAPGPAAFRVDATALERFGLDPKRARPAHRGAQKYVLTPSRTNPAPAPPETTQKIFLERGAVSKPTLTRLSAIETFGRLMRARHPSWLTEPAAAKTIERLLELAKTGSWQLSVPDDASQIEANARFLIDELTRITTNVEAAMSTPPGAL